jgi:Rne/Rng family ribonuclease
MSKELVISAASHERRVAILEEGQLVEIYIEREKEFALVGSIYKGKVTRVLPGMQSAFVDIGLDGDAFLYVSDVFENLEDYDHGHSDHAAAPAFTPAGSHVVEALPGETLARASAVHEVVSPDASNGPRAEEHSHEAAQEGRAGVDESADEEPMPGNEAPETSPIAAESHDDLDERQPDSNASAPQNFSPNYNPTQNYSSPRSDRGGDRGGQGYGRSDRGGDRGGRGRWGRRGGRHRGGRSHSGPAGRNLPPSKYASPQGDRDNRGNESRGNYENRGSDPRGHDRHDRGRGTYENRGGRGGFENRGYENRRPDNARFERPSSSAPSSSGASEEPILLPGESLAKYRGKPPAPPSPVVEPDTHEARQSDPEDVRVSGNVGGPLPSSGSSSSSGGPRRFTGGLPRWLLADAASDSETAPVSADENVGEAEDSSLSAHGANPSRHEASPIESPVSASSDSEDEAQTDLDLSEDQAAALASEFVEAKHEETAQQMEAGTAIGGAEFDEEEVEDLQAAVDAELDEEDEEAEEEDEADEFESSEELPVAETEIASDESGEIHPLRAAERAELEASVAHESAEHAAAMGQLDDHADEDEEESQEHEAGEHESNDAPAHSELIEASAAHGTAPVATDEILLPGETRSPRLAGAPREEFRDSARVGGHSRSRFQRPHRGGRDRGDRDRGDRGPRGRHDRGGRSGGHRFERRGPGGGQRHDRHHHRHSGPPRRPQLISEMLKAGQDVVVQIAKEPLGKKGARITSHVALPGRFLVYMPTIDHIGVSRKIASAENRSRLRRLVGEARGSYPGGFIVRTAAGGATDDEIRTDIEFLGKTWNEIKQRSEDRKAPALLHRDLNLVERILRDYVSDDFTGIWIDNEEEYGKIVEFVSRFQPKLVNKVKLYTKETPIFEEFGIQHELDKALRAKVWLKSGGYIVINHTEALVAIDVNTGKFVGKGSTRLEDTIVKTNLEAVKEIVRQIRLRDLGGIIVVDFIDMEERRNREKVLAALQHALEQDKAPSKALSFNEFGLVCITRKRTKQALERVLCQPCPYCTGSGMVKSIPTLCYEIQAEARKMAVAQEADSPNLTLRVHPEIAKALKTRESMLMDELEQTSHKHVIIQSDATLHWEQYDIY